MNYTQNYNLNLPQPSDSVDVSPLNANFSKIDELLKENADAIKNVKVPTDQTYQPNSTNPQSGIAVAQALKNVQIDVDDTVTAGSENPVSGGAVKTYVDGEISDVEKSVEEITSIFYKSVNLYNEKTNTSGMEISSTGVETVKSSSSTTDYIYLDTGSYVMTYEDTKRFAYMSSYNLDYTFVAGSRKSVNNDSYFTKNENSATFEVTSPCYVRFSGTTTKMPQNQIMLVKGTTLPTEYVPYKNEIKLEYIPVDNEYNAESERPQSGRAVAQAIANVEGIEPPQLHLSADVWEKGATVDTVFTSGIYYKSPTIKGNPLVAVSNESLGNVGFDCVENEKFFIPATQMAPAVFQSYFGFAKEDNISAITIYEVVNYVVYDVEKGGFIVTIPPETTKMYFLTTDETIEIKKIFGCYNIEWLKLKESNFPKNCVPYSALNTKEVENTISETVKAQCDYDFIKFPVLADAGLTESYDVAISVFDTLLVDNDGYVTKTTLGTDDFGNQLYEYTFGYADVRIESSPSYQLPTKKKPVIGIISGVHGSEKHPTAGLFYFLKALTFDNSFLLDRIKNNLTFKVIPIANPSGWNLNTNNNGNDVNINRNFTTNWSAKDPVQGSADNTGSAPASEKETQIIETWMANSSLDFFMDYHTSNMGTNLDGDPSFFRPAQGTNMEETIDIYCRCLRKVTNRWHRLYEEIGNTPLGYVTSAGSDYATSQAQAATIVPLSCLLEASSYLYWFKDTDGIYAHGYEWNADLIANLITEVYNHFFG